MISDAEGLKTTLAELEKLCAQATPGPWVFDSYSTVIGENDPDYDPHGDPSKVFQVAVSHGDTATAQGKKNADFLVAAREALPALLKIARAAEAVLADGEHLLHCDYRFSRKCDCPLRHLDAALAAFKPEAQV